MHSSNNALAGQFDDLEQQHEASSLGMWVFLATEIMFFGGLFTGYVIFRNLDLPAFEAGSRLLNVRIGAFNTAVLLSSSLTMALAVRAAQLGKRGAIIIFLALTLFLGLTFIGAKLILEWRHDFIEGFAPGLNWTFDGPDAAHLELFFCFYFFMTGVHAMHMVAGVGILTVLIVMAARGKFSPQRFNAVEMSGLYWHFVDIIWIFLLLTLLLGLTFVGAKLALEWRHDFIEGLVPGLNWTFNGPDAAHLELFFCFYFFMTGVHAAHMVVGVGILVVLIIMAGRGKFSPQRFNVVEMAGLYWHFVDIIWIFLFPLLYLIGGRY